MHKYQIQQQKQYHASAGKADKDPSRQADIFYDLCDPADQPVKQAALPEHFRFYPPHKA